VQLPSDAQKITHPNHEEKAYQKLIVDRKGGKINVGRLTTAYTRESSISHVEVGGGSI
jgi:hypothetical protein